MSQARHPVQTVRAPGSGIADSASASGDPASDELRLARRLAAADLVLEIASAAAAEPELDATLGSALERLRDIVPYSGASIALRQGTSLVVRATAGQRRRDGSGTWVVRVPGPALAVVRDGRPVRIDDVHRLGDPGRRAARAWLGAPIVRRSESIGLLELESTTPEAFSEDDEGLLATVGRALAGPIDAARRGRAEERARELRDAFIGVISHELRTPITTIYGMSQVLRQRHQTMDSVALGAVIEDIEAEADRLRRLAEDLLVLSRTEGGRLQVAFDPVLVGHVVRRRVADEAMRWPDHRFSADIPVGLPLVLGEEMYVEQVVQNLLSNAAKYSSPGSEIRIEVSQPDDELIVRVLDEGIGIAPDSIDTLFDLFYRAPSATRQASGAGIGLFVCRELIESMGGRIWARRRDPRGSEFGFALPVVDASESDDALG